jgi:hypothetical protein
VNAVTKVRKFTTWRRHICLKGKVVQRFGDGDGASTQVTYAGTGPQGSNIIDGGVWLDPEKWTALSGHSLPHWFDPWSQAAGSTLLAYNLSGVDLGPLGWGDFSNGGLGQCTQTRAELFVNGQPMVIARYPDAPLTPGEPWMNWSHITEPTLPHQQRLGAAAEAACASGKPLPRDDHGRLLVGLSDLRSPGSPYASWPLTQRDYAELTGTPMSHIGDAADTSGLGFTCMDIDEERARRWINVTSAEQWTQVWAHGFWAFDWADNYINLLNFSYDATARATVFTINPATPPVYQLVKRARFYVVNLAAVLNEVGEYWVDTDANMLYFVADSKWDPRHGGGSISTVMGTTSDNLVGVNPGVQFINFANLEFANVRGTALALNGVSQARLDTLTANGVGHTAFALNGANITAASLGSSGAGCHASAIGGGNSQTLEMSGNSIMLSLFERYSRWTRTYNPGISFNGVGHQILYNTIRHAPHNGLQGGGNNLLFGYNNLSHLCYEVRDSGAFYIGRSWVNRGVVLLQNRFSEIAALEPTFLGASSVQAMYFDDQQSGVSALGNVCDNVTACFLVGGGRDNTITNTVCRDVTESCILFDNRGMNWQAGMCAANPPGMLVQQLEQVNYQQPPYSTAYPLIVNTMQFHPCVPVGNLFANNTCCGCGTGQVLNQPVSVVESWFSNATDNVATPTC